MVNSSRWDITRHMFRGTYRFLLKGWSMKHAASIPASCSLFSWLILRHCILSRRVPPKYRLSFNGLHEAVSQKVVNRACSCGGSSFTARFLAHIDTACCSDWTCSISSLIVTTSVRVDSLQPLNYTEELEGENKDVRKKKPIHCRKHSFWFLCLYLHLGLWEGRVSPTPHPAWWLPEIIWREPAEVWAIAKVTYSCA
jgi:hypothetical protein